MYIVISFICIGSWLAFTEHTTSVSKSLYFPTIQFKKQSAVYDTLFPKWENFDTSSYLPEKVIGNIVNDLNNNPAMIIELCAHCSADEKDVENLSAQRALKVKKDILKYGIDEKRVFTKGYAVTKPLMKQDELLKATNEEREYMQARNRRCLYKILSFDYGKTQATDNKSSSH